MPKKLNRAFFTSPFCIYHDMFNLWLRLPRGLRLRGRHVRYASPDIRLQHR